MIGREREIAELKALCSREESQFCAVFGRRRVGKTYLVRETFQKQFTFYHTGLANATKEEQLAEFKESLRKYGLKKARIPRTWYDAFHQMEVLLEQSEDEKKIIFIDELPWMDSSNSNFISALEHFWNGWANMRNDIVLIICGSATSWMISNILNNHGGLYGRLTHQIHLQPFTLYECEQYMHAMDIALSRKEIIEAYMIMGGIPYYWSYMQRGMSLAQNIDNLFFRQGAPLKNEFSALYQSLFRRPEGYIAIVEALTRKKSGMTRDEILRATDLDDNSTFIRQMTELEQCGFIRSYHKLGQKKKDTLFQLMDNFTLFYYQYIKTNELNDEHYWTNSLTSARHNTWAGLAFERICFQHIEQIKQKLGILGISSQVYSFTYHPKPEEDPGWAVQIDMLIERTDGIINLCEIKYSSDDYLVTEQEERRMRKRISCLQQRAKTKKAIHTVLITTYGVVDNAYSHIFQKFISADALFQPIWI